MAAELNYYPDVTKQNITDKLYHATLINNTGLELSEALSELVGGIAERTYGNSEQVQDALNGGEITEDTFVMITVQPAGLHAMDGPSGKFVVDTAARIIELYPILA